MRPEDVLPPPPDPRDEWVTSVTAFRSWAALEQALQRGYMPTLRPRLYMRGSHEQRATTALRIEVAFWLVRELARNVDDVARSMCPMLEEHERALLDARVARELGERTLAGRESPAPSHFVDVAVHACRISGRITGTSLMQSARALDGEPS